MGFLKKLKKGVKKVRKALKIPPVTLGNVAKAGGIAATGGIGGLAGAVALSKLKSAAIGGAKQLIKAKAQRAVLSRLKRTAPVPVLAQPKVVDIRATTMPGGSPIRGVKVPKARRAKAPKAKAPRKAAKASGTKRTAPKGGKDFKALSAAWKAAGKPGKWIDWVKSH